MPDIVEDRIRAIVTELVESSPAPIPISALDQRIQIKRSTRLPRSGPVLMVAVAVLVLMAGLVGALIGRNLAPTAGGPTTSIPSDGPFAPVELANSHPAKRILDAGVSNSETFATAASEQDLSYVCATGGGPTTWEMCLVAANGVLAIVPFNGSPGLTAVVSGGYLPHPTSVSMSDGPLGIPNTGPGARVAIEYQGETIGETTAPWTSP